MVYLNNSGDTLKSLEVLEQIIMKSTKNMLTYYKIKSNFNKKFDELEAEMLKGVPGSKEEYDKLLVEYKKFTNDYLKR